MEERLIESARGVRSESFSAKPFFVFMPGMSGGGKDLTIFRKFFGKNGYAPSSISTHQTHKKSEGTFQTFLQRHYAHMVKEVAVRSEGRDLVIVGDSLGGEETLDLVDQLLTLKDWGGKKLSLVFKSVPGFGLKGISGLMETLRRISNIDLGLQESEYLYPLPERYYRNLPQPPELGSPPGVTRISDTVENKIARRERFETSMLGKVVKGKQAQKDILNRLAEIDQQILGVIPDGQLKQKLWRERSRITKPIVDALARGEQFDDEIHQRFRETYKESAEDLLPTCKYYANALLYLVRSGKHIWKGMDRRLGEVLAKAKQRDIDINFRFVLADKDNMLTLSDIEGFQEGAAEEILGAFSGTLFLEASGHTSPAYDIEVLQKILNGFGYDFQGDLN